MYNTSFPRCFTRWLCMGMKHVEKKEVRDKEAFWGRVLPSRSPLCFCQHTSIFPKDQSDYITLQREEDEHKGWEEEGLQWGRVESSEQQMKLEKDIASLKKPKHKQLQRIETDCLPDPPPWQHVWVKVSFRRGREGKADGLTPYLTAGQGLHDSLELNNRCDMAVPEQEVATNSSTWAQWWELRSNRRKEATARMPAVCNPLLWHSRFTTPWATQIASVGYRSCHYTCWEKWREKKCLEACTFIIKDKSCYKRT